MKEQILIFELDDEALRAKVRQALLPLRFRVKFIQPEQYVLTLGELTASAAQSAGTKQSTDDSQCADVAQNGGTNQGAGGTQHADAEQSTDGGKDCSANQSPDDGQTAGAGQDAPVKQASRHEALPAPMLVFAGLTSARLDAALKALRQRQAVIPHKAVLTGHNAMWTPRQLFAELDEEHRRFQGGAQ